jgi:ribosomal protein S18 acetylase RimI-like enzyme
MPNLDDAVVPLDFEEQDEAARMMARAFTDDPVYRYLLRNPRYFEHRLNWMMNFMLRVCARRGLVHRIGEPLQGVAAWLSPGQRVTIMDEVIAGVVGGSFVLGVGSAWRSNSIMTATLKNRERLTQGRPYWYLWQFAVSAQSRGKGYGRALLQPVLAQADLTETDCWLDNSNAANLPIYEALGFHTAEEFTIANGQEPIKLWHMRRKPVKQLTRKK